MPVDGDLGDLDAGAAADGGAVVAADGDGGGRLGEHEHLDVEDPALGVHVGDDVGQGRAREELEAALGVAQARGGGRREDGEDDVEGPHEEVAQGRAPDDGVAADEVAAAADGDAATAAVDDLLAALEEAAEVAEPGGAVGVREERVLAAHVPQPVRHAAALAAVPLQRHHPQHVVQAVLARELERHLHRPVPAAVVHDEDLVARQVLLLPRRVLSVLASSRGRSLGKRVRVRTSVAAEGRVEVFDGFFQGRQDAVLLVVRREHDAHAHFGGLDGPGIRDVQLGRVVILASGLARVTVR